MNNGSNNTTHHRQHELIDAGAAEQARTRLRDTLASHTTDCGVYFDSRAWIITARRR
ncbi:hypothetical protein GCM10023318_36100 [Nocardia callitridis]|uniref:Uncharacterized protein n=1 Tax=Nocardia callitridis TaxID=648753 RepID=A0ABP9KHJ9_9NOCA